MKILKRFILLEVNSANPRKHVINQVTMIFIGTEAIYTYVVRGVKRVGLG